MIKCFKTILWIVSLRCEESDRLMSDSLDRRLNWAERAALSGHTLSCRGCRRARQQLRTLRRSMQTLLDQIDPAAGSETLSPEARGRIRASLKNSG